MNIKLIFPPSTSQNHTANPILSLGALKAYLDKKNINTDIVDLEILVKYKGIDLKIFNDKKVVFRYLLKNIENMQLNFCLSRIMGLTSLNNFDMVGFSIMGIRQFLISLCLAKKIKKQFKSKIILGGFYPQSNAANILKIFNFVDYIVEKEGEIAIEFLVKKMEEKNIPFLYYRQDNKIKKSNKEKYVDIDNLPLPNFDGLPLYIYKKYLTYLELPYELSRGCIANCIFCSFPKYGALRVKRIKKIINDLKILKNKYSSRKFIFYNSEINMTKEWSKAFLGELIRSKLNIEWVGYLIPKIDESIAQLLQASGCQEVKVGIESGDNEILTRMGKYHRVKDAEGTIRLLDKYKINAHYYFITGYPYETEKQYLNTINFIKKNRKRIKKARINSFELEYNTKIFNATYRYGISRRPFKQNVLVPTERLPFDEITGLRWEEKTKQQIQRKKLFELVFTKLNIKNPPAFC